MRTALFTIALLSFSCFEKKAPSQTDIPLPALDKAIKDLADGTTAKAERAKFYAVAKCPGNKEAEIGWHSGPDEKPPAERWERNLIKDAAAATVEIRAWRYSSDKGVQEYSGTGTIISRDGTVLTAWHVVENADFVTASPRAMDYDGGDLPSEREFPLRIVRFSKSKDAALLKPIHPQVFPDFAEGFETDAPVPCQQVWHFGKTTGWSRGFLIKEQAAAVGVDPVHRLAMKIAAGDSGGPLTDRAGNIVGIVIAEGYEGAEGAYAVPIADALEALKPKVR